VETGKLVWSRRFEVGNVSGFTCDETNVYDFGETARIPGWRGTGLVIMSLSDGSIKDTRDFPPDRGAGGGRGPTRMAACKGTLYYLLAERTLCEYSVATGEVLRHAAVFGNLEESATRQITTDGAWIWVRQERGGQPIEVWLLRAGDPAYQFRTTGILSGDVAFEVPVPTNESPPRLRPTRIVDLAAGKELPLTVPPGARLLDAKEYGDKLWMLLGFGPYGQAGRDDSQEESRVELRALDRRSGRTLQSQAIGGSVLGSFSMGGLRGRRIGQLVPSGSLVLVSEAGGIQALTSAPPAAAPRRSAVLAHATSRPVTIDGSLDDWDARAMVPIRGPDGVEGKVCAAHDDKRLYIALSYAERRPEPSVGRFGSGGGNWLELGLWTAPVQGQQEIGGSYRWAIGFDAQGRTTSQNLMPGPRENPDLRGAVRYDVASGQLTYELSVPMNRLFWRNSDSGSAALSMVAWDDPGCGQRRRLEWGGGLSGRSMVPAALQPLHLMPLTLQAQEAFMAVLDATPELPETFAAYLRMCEIREPSPEGRLALYRQFIAAHPGSITADRLAAFDRSLRRSLGDDPSGQLLSAAEQAGVSEPVRRRYGRVLQDHLALQVYVERKAGAPAPRSVTVQLDSGLSQDPLANSVTFGEDRGGRPALSLPRHIAIGVWNELKIPLFMMDMQDKPVCGIALAVRCEQQLYWDGVAVVIGGQKHALLSGTLPAGETSSPPRWAAAATGAARSLAVPAPRGVGTESRWALTKMAQPIMDHIVPPDGPYLAQWVWVDPKSPPASLMVSLADATGWRYSFVWGARALEGRRMGPVPAPGEWRELRMPLAWTPLATRPMTAIAFGRSGGHVFWERTALVMDGKETVLIGAGAADAQTSASGGALLNLAERGGLTADTPIGYWPVDTGAPEWAAPVSWVWVEPPDLAAAAKAAPAGVAPPPSAVQGQGTQPRATVPQVPRSRCHTDSGGDGYVTHALKFPQPVTAQVPFDRGRAVDAMKTGIAALEPSPEAWQLLEVLMQVDAAEAAEQINYMKWFLKIMPGHPRTVELLGRILAQYRAAGDKDPPAAVDAFLAETGLPNQVGYQYRRRYLAMSATSLAITRWQVLGPMPTDQESAGAPESRPVDLKARFKGTSGEVRWAPHEAPLSTFDFVRVLGQANNVAAYAACWVWSDKAQPTIVEMVGTGAYKLWANNQPVPDESDAKAGPRARFLGRVDLKAGWNELLVKSLRTDSAWGFTCELVEALGRGAPAGVKLSTTPPD